MKKVGKVFQTIALFFFAFLFSIYLPFYITFLTIRIEVKNKVIDQSVDKLNLIYVWENSQDYSSSLDDIAIQMETIGLPKQVLNELIQSNAIKTLLKERVNKSVNYFCYQKKLEPLKQIELVKVIKTGTKEAIQKLKVKKVDIKSIFPEEKQSFFYQQLDFVAPQLLNEIPKVEEIMERKLKEPILKEFPRETSTLEERYNNSLSILHFFFSYRALVIMTEGLIVLILIILGINKFKQKNLKWLGGSFLLANIAAIVIRTFGLNKIDQIKTPFSLIPAQNYIIEHSEKLFIAFNYFILLLAVICLGIHFGIIISKKKRENRNKTGKIG